MTDANGEPVVNLDEEIPPLPPPVPPAKPILPAGVSAETWSAGEMRENVRGVIAKWLVLLLAALVTIPFWFVAWRSDQSDNVLAILQVVLGPVVALVGSATGFYFGLERSAVNQSAPARTPAPTSDNS